MSTGLTEQYSRSYNSFGGTDILATFAGVRVGELQGISFTVSREKAPIYTMGNPDPRGFSRGKRGIAGSLVIATFDRSALLDALTTRGRGTFISNMDQISQEKRRFMKGPNTGTSSGLTGNDAVSSIGTGVAVPTTAWYPDQLPPFSIVINAINEYGHRASMAIHGVEILNSGSGMSIDDIMMDESMTFVATEIIPWKPEPYIVPGSNVIRNARQTSGW